MSVVTSEHKAFLAGIGGIGVSALAQWLAADGWQVEGTDRTRSEITDLLNAHGIPVSITEQPVLPAGTELLVYSDAVPSTHPIRQAAAARAIRSVSYAELLGECSAGRSTIAVSGSHGKSTTTALVGLLLEAMGRDPRVVAGTRVPSWGQYGVGNFRLGKGTLAVVEADEYRSHFLNLKPNVAVVTSVDHDHVDAFPTPVDYERAFHSFVSLVPKDGRVVLKVDDPATGRLCSVVGDRSLVTFGVDVAADVQATGIKVRDQRQEFELTVQGLPWGRFGLRVPGAHMAANAAAAIAAALPFGLKPDTARETLAAFRGTWRRFELVGTLHGASVISDYAHHPTELRALAAAARQWYPREQLVIAFQPHQRARTRVFAAAFIAALQDFDDVVLAEVYDVAGREEHNQVSTGPWVTALSAAGKSSAYTPSLTEVEQGLRERARPGTALFVVGAGDIDLVARRLAHPSRKHGST